MKEFFSKLFGNKSAEAEQVEKETRPLIGTRFSHKKYATNPFDSSGFWNVQVIACKDEWVKFIRQNGSTDSMSLQAFTYSYKRTEWKN